MLIFFSSLSFPFPFSNHSRWTTLHDDTRVGGDTLGRCQLWPAKGILRGGTYGPQLSGFLADGAGDGGALHLTLGVDDLRPC